MFLPKMYKKNIFEINYGLLKKRGIRCLLFDLDNTIALIDQNKISNDTLDLINSLKKDFLISIISNNTNSRVSKYGDMLKCDYICNSMKPLKKGFKKARNKYNLSYSNICVIGDQLVTDIFGANRVGCYSVLVDPMGKKDLKITSFNRFIERIILKKYKKKKVMEVGKYYE